MKKFLMVIMVMILFLSACSSETENWKVVEIKGCGIIKIPNEWDCFVQDDVIYIMEDEKPKMISYKRTDQNESNAYYTNFKYIDFTTSAVLSNSAIYGKAKYLYLDKEIERFYLDLGETTSGEWIEFLVWDETVSEELLISIAKTFVHE